MVAARHTQPLRHTQRLRRSQPLHRYPAQAPGRRLRQCQATCATAERQDGTPARRFAYDVNTLLLSVFQSKTVTADCDCLRQCNSHVSQCLSVPTRDCSSADAFTGVFIDRSQSRDISGSISLLRNANLSSYLTDVRFYLTQYFVLQLLLGHVAQFCCGFMGAWITEPENARTVEVGRNREGCKLIYKPQPAQQQIQVRWGKP